MNLCVYFLKTENHKESLESAIAVFSPNCIFLTDCNCLPENISSASLGANVTLPVTRRKRCEATTGTRCDFRLNICDPHHPSVWSLIYSLESAIYIHFNCETG